jgi:hypothetical protein
MFFFLVRRGSCSQFISGIYTGIYLTLTALAAGVPNLELLLSGHRFTPEPYIKYQPPTGPMCPSSRDQP